MAKYYVKSGSLELIYSTRLSAFDAARMVLWECNENDQLDEFFYVDERGFRNYVSADPNTKVFDTERILRLEGWA